MPRRRGDAPGPASGQVPLARTQAEGYPRRADPGGTRGLCRV